MPRENKDFLTQIREQTEKTLALLTAEIRRREAELEKLLEQVRLWRDALTESIAPGLLPTTARGTPKKRTKKKRVTAKRKTSAAKRTASSARKKSAQKKATTARKKKAARPAKRATSSGRVDWDEVLAALPSTFTIDDVMSTPGARAKGRNQVYPAINRWVKAKKARKVGTGRYKRGA